MTAAREIWDTWYAKRRFLIFPSTLCQENCPSSLKESSVEGEKAWTWSEERQQYYLHNFFDFVPDLNLRNDTVRQIMKVRMILCFRAK